MALFPDGWMAALLSKNDIVSVVSPYVQLRPKGGRLWGLCPFHGEKTPSFSVIPEKQFYYCFGCHKGGGVIQFIMEIERLSYPEAVRLLADRSGMELPGEVDDAAIRKERTMKDRLERACRAAALYYHKQLRSEAGRPAREYLARRGLTQETVKTFGLGYAPPGWDGLFKHLVEEGYTEAELLAAGLLVQNAGSGKVYDAYRNRVIFPIIGVRGRVLGFGARAMGDEKPKYINTGDTPIFNKRANLYGLNRLKGGSQPLLMVEGYMDVIGLHQAGITHAVASLGTALTQQQARLIRRYTDSVYIAYDGDFAGQNATLRGLDILAREGLKVKVIVLPSGLDPDEFIRQEGRDAFDALRDRALSLNAFKLERMATGYDLMSEDGREGYAKAACAFIAGLEPVEQERYYPALAQRTGLPLAALKAQGAIKSAGSAREAANTAEVRYAGGETTPTTQSERAERLLIRAALASEAAAKQAEASGVLKHGAYGSFLALICAAYARGGPPDPALLLSTLEPSETQALAGLLEDEGIPLADPARAAADCIRELRAMAFEREIRALRRETEAETMTTDEKLALAARIQALDAERRALRAGEES